MFLSRAGYARGKRCTRRWLLAAVPAARPIELIQHLLNMPPGVAQAGPCIIITKQVCGAAPSVLSFMPTLPQLVVAVLGAR